MRIQIHLEHNTRLPASYSKLSLSLRPPTIPRIEKRATVSIVPVARAATATALAKASPGRSRPSEKSRFENFRNHP